MRCLAQARWKARNARRPPGPRAHPQGLPRDRLPLGAFFSRHHGNAACSTPIRRGKGSTALHQFYHPVYHGFNLCCRGVQLLVHPLYQERDPRKVRDAIRREEWTGVTAGLAPGSVQANLVLLPKEGAYDFLLFCQRNPKPCPLLEVTDAGSPEPRLLAPGADLRCDLPRYRVFHNGQLQDEPLEITAYWRDDLVAFLLGCSFTFEQALLNAGLPVRGLEQSGTFSAFITNISCVPAGKLRGNMVVTMRPMTPGQAVQAVRVTSRFTKAHGAPVHIGDPQAIGINRLDRPDFGQPVEVRPGEVPVFWACGITPQVVAMESGIPFMITHAPGHMFITDLRDEDLALE
ncbi:MAG: putative hydro-lyase [Chloroflexi bacterium]|nr:putative hydro-lyase [Chloroflexota bacterium]